MAKLDYEQMAKDIVAAVGGPENINTVAHCMTRIRFVLKNDNNANSETISDTIGFVAALLFADIRSFGSGHKIGKYSDLRDDLCGNSAS